MLEMKKTEWRCSTPRFQSFCKQKRFKKKTEEKIISSHGIGLKLFTLWRKEMEGCLMRCSHGSALWKTLKPLHLKLPRNSIRCSPMPIRSVRGGGRGSALNRKAYDALLLDAGGTLLQLAKPVEEVYASIGTQYGSSPNSSPQFPIKPWIFFNPNTNNPFLLFHRSDCNSTWNQARFQKSLFCSLASKSSLPGLKLIVFLQLAQYINANYSGYW